MRVSQNLFAGPFLREFAKDHKVIGAVAPSSSFLAREMVRGLRLESRKVIVEFGPGTGAFTREIVRRARPDSRFVAIEVNEKMARSFRAEFPGVTLVHDSAERLPKILNDIGETSADCIVSGLPWAFFSADQQDRILDTACDCLAEGGTFATFCYLHGMLLPQGQRFKRALHSRFRSVSKSNLEFRNLPPAFVYWCAK